MAFLKVLFYLVVLILVLVLAYYTTRILGRGMRLKQRTGGMEVLDQMTVVVKVQEKILLLGVSPSGIEKLDKLDSYEKMEPAEAPPDFVAVLSSQLKARRRGEDDGMKKGGRGKE